MQINKYINGSTDQIEALIITVWQVAFTVIMHSLQFRRQHKSNKNSVRFYT